MTRFDPADVHPVAAESDLAPRHAHHARLLGQELAVWQADDGNVNVWENRCPHRGVRLSTAMNEGSELVCQYHGWRYANRSGSCTYIPAHPADAPPRSIGATTYRSHRRYGLVWAGPPESEQPPVVPSLEGGFSTLRGLPLRVPAHAVLEALESHAFQPHSDDSDAGGCTERRRESPHSVTVSAGGDTIVYFVQPSDVDRSVVRPVLAGTPAAPLIGTLRRHHSAELERFRAEVEATSAAGTAVELPRLRPIPRQLSTGATGGRVAPIEAVVSRRWPAATDVVGLELNARSGDLPSFQPGAHIDVHLPNGLVRQYSLTNAPNQTDRYRIGVKVEPNSRGGSRWVDQHLSEGDTLAISEPRNNFPLRRDARTTLLLAGGIGITPLLGMAQTLALQQLPFALHYFVRDEQHRAFPELLADLGAAMVEHIGRSPEQTTAELRQLLQTYEPGTHTYICGPGPMLEAARAIAAECGWPDDAVHFEYFENSIELDDSKPFEVELSRSGVKLRVPAGQTLLNVLREAGVDVMSSCEQGACGTCIVDVIEGEPDHQDVYLSVSERARNDRMLTCVSRAATGRLVLDL